MPHGVQAGIRARAECIVFPGEPSPVTW